MKTNVRKSTRDIISVKNDISRITALIEKREKWLNDPVNRMRNTWLSVHRDTMQMVERLKDLEDELIKMSNH